MGGRPAASFFFVGCQGERVHYLDPHTTQPSLRPDDMHVGGHVSYTPTLICSMLASYMDPSMAVCFLVHSEASLHDLLRSLRENRLLSEILSVTHRPGDFSDRVAGEGCVTSFEMDLGEGCVDDFNMDDFENEKESKREKGKQKEQVVVIDGEEWGLI